jgi:hypothetical protein
LDGLAIIVQSQWVLRFEKKKKKNLKLMNRRGRVLLRLLGVHSWEAMPNLIFLTSAQRLTIFASIREARLSLKQLARSCASIRHNAIQCSCHLNATETPHPAPHGTPSWKDHVLQRLGLVSDRVSCVGGKPIRC